MDSAVPLVSVVLVVLNEAPHLAPCVDALARQTYPHDRIELLIVDGGSTDGSRDIATRYVDRLPLRLLGNPAVRTPAGLNVGVRAAHGEIVIILGARARVAPDFIALNVAALSRTGADAVGGVVDSAPQDGGDTPTARAIGLALSSAFGVGDARYRYGGEAGEVDTVNYGAYRRDVFARVGLFDEELQWVEDDEFNYRLRAAGGRLWLDPAIHVRYAARGTLAALWRQQFRWGLHKPKVARRHPAQMRPRHAVPALFVGSVLGSTALAPAWRPTRVLLGAALAAYGLTSSAATIQTVRRARPRPSLSVLARLPLAFGTMHVAYGTGMLLGLARELLHPRLPAPPPLLPRR